MVCAIRYYSKGGNTKKMAEAVGEVLNLEAMPTVIKLENKVDILFLGSSVYAGKYTKEVEVFLNQNKENIGEIVCFDSSASGKSTYHQVKKWADKNGINISDRYFNCLGHFLFAHKNRPNAEDLEYLQNFVKEIINR